MVVLDSQKIVLELPDEMEIIVLDRIDSTNDYFKAHKPSKKISFCLAEYQTQGRGRLDRTWHSPFGKNIYLSCCYCFQKNIHELAGLSLVIGLAIVAAMRELSLMSGVSVKWPNDVLYNGKKIAGILIEANSSSSVSSEIIIGVGLNVNMMPDEQSASQVFIQQAWTSLREILGAPSDRNHVVSLLLRQLYRYIRRFEQRGLRDFMEEWTLVDELYGKPVTLDGLGRPIEGVAMGVNSSGCLLLRLVNGDYHAFSSGEAFLLKKQSIS